MNPSDFDSSMLQPHAMRAIRLQQVIDEIGRDKLIEAIEYAQDVMYGEIGHDVPEEAHATINEFLHKFLDALREDEDADDND